MSFHAIAIDGPAASGKSTMARALAERLGLVMVNSGAMYRAVTWKVLDQKIDPNEQEKVVDCIEKLDIECGDDGTFSTISINGTNPEPFLRKPEINENVSIISAIPDVRKKLVGMQREYLKKTHVVMEGRDIGSVVFPDTPFKIYIDADPTVRNSRRSGDGEVDSVAKRDAADSSRATAPLIIAEGATVLDTSSLNIEEAIQAAIEILKRQGFPISQNLNS
ncbi:MAG: (d)CMP kinase [Akkermansiaceae bacterium]